MGKESDAKNKTCPFVDRKCVGSDCHSWEPTIYLWEERRLYKGDKSISPEHATLLDEEKCFDMVKINIEDVIWKHDESIGWDWHEGEQCIKIYRHYPPPEPYGKCRIMSKF